MNDLAREFWSHMEAAEQRLSLISDEESRRPFRAGGWLRKEVLGHLVDSACINHVRIVMAATQGSFEGPSYDQSAWVALHGYAHTPWPAILDQWRARNTWLAEAVTNISPDQLSAPCKIGSNAAIRLDELIRDYLAHLEHHLTQLIAKAA